MTAEELVDTLLVAPSATAAELAAVRRVKRLGFTGTGKAPLRPAQRARLRFELSLRADCLEPVELHLGDCIHADAECYELAEEMNASCRHLRSAAPFLLIGHPPVNPRYRAFLAYHVELPAKGYTERDDDIVAVSEELLACPRGAEEELRSGTWTTVRHALKRGVKVLIIWPDGSTADGREWYLKYGSVKGVLQVLNPPPLQRSLNLLVKAAGKGEQYDG
jgi:hypothetical protein